METTANNLPAIMSGALTKSEQANVAEQFVNAVLEGVVNPMEAYARAKALAETLNFIFKDKRFGDLVITECEKFGKEKPEWHGVSFSVAEVGVKYDYTDCGDSVYDDIVAQIDELTERRKEREAFLRTIRPEMNIADATTGEILNAPTKTSATSVKLTFKK